MKIFFSFLKKYYLSLVFVIFILLMGVNYIYGVADTTADKYDSYYNKQKPSPQYLEDYIPLLEEEGIALTATNSGAHSTSQRLKKSVSLTLETMQSDIDFFLVKDSMLKLNAFSCKTAGMNHIPGTTYFKTSDGMLSYLPAVEDAKNTTDRNLNLLKAFTDAINKKGINTLYVACPNKDYILGTETPIGLSEDSDTDMTAYTINGLKDAGINHLDLWSVMEPDGITPAELYYKTDHHWKSEYGIYAAEKIADRLNADFGYNIDTNIYESDNYHTDVYPDSLLGSIGINSTEAFTSAEDFSVHLPKEMGSYSFSIPSKNVDLKGDFNVFINNEKLDNKEYWPFNAYASYIYANSAYVSVKNHNIDDNHKVLVIKDSYANIIVPYLAQTVESIDVIDIRTSQDDHFSDSVFELIETNNYDTILFINSSPSEFEALFLK